MRERIGWGLVALWTVLVILGVVRITKNADSDVTYSAQPIKFSVSTTREIDLSGPATVSGGSCSYFFLKKEGSEPIEAVWSTPPLGINCSDYFQVKNVPISAGRWTIGQGIPTLEFASETPIQVTTIETSDGKFGNAFMAFLFGVIIWIVGLAFGIGAFGTLFY